MNSINKVLRAPVNERKKVWTQIMKNVKLPRSVSQKLHMGRFPDGQLALWTAKQKNITPTEGKPDVLTRTTCESEHKWAKGAEVLLRLVGEVDKGSRSAFTSCGRQTPKVVSGTTWRC